jgi:mRNA-degrading endonuclease RelE of RelBE toxin-antitoxin system
MPWRLIIASRAVREMESLPRREREAMVRALDQLVADFGRADVRKLGGRSHEWRLRVGRLRVILALDNENGIINVIHVLPRGRAYRR